MVTYKKGDLLKSNCNIICHQVNCQGVMGSGIAKQIRENYPYVYKEYKRFCSECDAQRLMGAVQILAISDDKMHFIANMFAQLHYLPRGINHTDYTQFRMCCMQIKSTLRERDSRLGNLGESYTIGFPDHIGCGLGGGDWNIVKGIIEDEFAGDRWNVEIWKLS